MIYNRAWLLLLVFCLLATLILHLSNFFITTISYEDDARNLSLLLIWSFFVFPAFRRSNLSQGRHTYHDEDIYIPKRINGFDIKSSLKQITKNIKIKAFGVEPGIRFFCKSYHSINL